MYSVSSHIDTKVLLLSNQKSTQRHKENDLVNKALHFLVGCLGTKISAGVFLLPENGSAGDEV